MTDRIAHSSQTIGGVLRTAIAIAAMTNKADYTKLIPDPLAYHHRIDNNISTASQSCNIGSSDLALFNLQLDIWYEYGVLNVHDI